MIFDDHDVHDDWNTSKDWVEEYRQKPWWDERIVGGLMSYWIYQHFGNLSPRELEEDELYQRVCDADDAGPMLREFAYKADREVGGARWSYCRQIGQSKLIVMDSRAGRVLEPGERQMVDDEEWDYIQRRPSGDYNHLFLATSLPYLLAPGMQYLEAWNEAVCDGAWGKRWAKLGEKIRQELDLEHWGAFQQVVPPGARAARGGRLGRERAPAARVDRVPVRRRPPRLPGGGRVQARRRDEVGRLPGGLLAVPQPARREASGARSRRWRAPARWITGALARPRACATRGSAGGSCRTRRSTTRSPRSSGRGARRRDAIEKAVPERPGSPQLENVFEQRIA